MARRTFLCTAGQAAAGAAVARCLCGEACAATAGHDLCDAAVCGIYCNACPALLSSKKAKTPGEIKCLGCLSKEKTPSYAPKCEIRKCATAQSLVSCGLCKQYPCDKIKGFFNETPKYGLREKYLNEIRDKGMAAWRSEMKTRWTCKSCGAPFGYGMTACASCGAKVWSDAEEFAEFKKSKG
jgi:hypothetical protein